MTRKEALTDLLAKVKAGDEILTMGGTGQFKVFGFGQMSRASAAYHGSLDAAKALHDAVLPGGVWNLSNSGTYLAINGKSFGDAFEPCSNPARALLIAIIKALIAQEESA